MKNIEPKRTVMIGKLGTPLLSIAAFAISSDLSAMALGEIDGTLKLYKAKNIVVNDFKE